MRRCDLATGAGLIDAHRAVLVAKLRCSVIRPPIGPVVPVQPVQPVTPITPVGPIRPPIGPVVPVQPVAPIRPPIQPPIQPPIRPPIGPIAPPSPEGGSLEERVPQPLSEDDIAALEGFIGLGDLDESGG